MACSVTFAFTFGGPPGAKFLQIDATNSPLFCELEFFIDRTSVAAYGLAFFPADGLHGGPPNVNFFSNWRISVPISDTQAGIFPAFVQITGGDNDYTLIVPSALAQAVVVPGSGGTLIVLTTASDGGACGPYTFSIISSPSHGVLTGTPPNVTYTPTAGYTGPDSFVFQASGCGANSQATISITVASSACEITVPIDASSGGSGCAISNTLN